MAEKGKKAGRGKRAAKSAENAVNGAVKKRKAKRTTRRRAIAAADTPDVYSASLRHVRISPQKARLVMDLVRGLHVERALDILRFSPKKGSRLIEKLVRSAIANAQEKARVDVDRLVVQRCWVDGGRVMKRFMPRARGSADQILKRSAHMTVELIER